MKNRAEVRGQRPCTRAAMMVAPRWDVARASGGPKSASAVALQRAKNKRREGDDEKRDSPVPRPAAPPQILPVLWNHRSDAPRGEGKKNSFVHPSTQNVHSDLLGLI